MKYIIACALAISFFSLSCNNNTKLADDATVRKHFTEEEIDGLQYILDFFDKAVQEKIETKSIEESYWLFFDSLASVIKVSGEMKSVLVEDFQLATSSKTEGLIEDLKANGVFNEIWTPAIWHQSPSGFKHKDTSAIELSPNLNGGYLSFLKDIGQKDTFIMEYHNGIEASGDIPPSNIAAILNHNFGAKYFRQDTHRLVWAIHYLTIYSSRPYLYTKEDSDIK